MIDLDWIRAKLEVADSKKTEKQLTTKQFIDKRAFRENMITGKETMDSEGFVWCEWTGLFFDLTGNKMSEQQFAEYSDWVDSYIKSDNLPIYDNLKIWFDSRNIKMLPKVRESRKITNEDMEQIINKVLEKIYRIRGENGV